VFFALGHVHATRIIDEPGGARAIYPGSPQAMDPAEPGAHGLYILEVASGSIECRFFPLSTVRYESVDVPIDEVTAIEHVDSEIIAAVRDRLIQVNVEEPHVAHLRCKIRLTGRTPFHRQLEVRLRDRLTDLEVGGGRLTASVDSLEVATGPASDLFALASAGGPPAIVARLLNDLANNPDGRDHESLFVETRRAINEIALSPSYLPVLETDGLPIQRDGALREEISRAGALLLDEMLSQKEVDG
jgi:DNA repair exonuclease SbcCD nuclease subunit